MIVLCLIQKARLVLVSIFLVCYVFAQSTEDRLGQVVSALQNKDFEGALELLRLALQVFFGNAQLWAMQGVVYAGKGQKKEALASFHKALKISPDYLPALHGAIQIEYGNGSLAAIPFLQHVLRLQFGDSTSHAMLAVLQYRQGDCPVVVGYFEKAGAFFDSQLEGLYAYATCLVKLKQPDKVVGVFQRVLALNLDDRRDSKDQDKPKHRPSTQNECTKHPRSRGQSTREHRRTPHCSWRDKCCHYR